ncbi:MAG: DEAD/DEAH box helicase [bacterium]
MVLTEDALSRVDQHWAIMAIGARKVERAMEVAKVRVMRAAVGHQMAIAFDETSDDHGLIEHVAMAYEIAAIEGLSEVLHPSGDDQRIQLRLQTQAGSFRAYALRRTLPIPLDSEERMFHVLHIAALAYCGDQWTDLRRWLKDHERAVRAPSVANASWDNRIVRRLYDCWLRLLRKQGWDDLDGVREIIAGLRNDQAQYESGVLAGSNTLETQATALRLIALYHWAKATEFLAIYMLQGQPVGIESELDKHFEAGQKAAVSGQDPALEVILRWLHAASRRMVAGSLWKVAQAVNSRVTHFVRSVTKSRSMFELLPPQRAALQEQGLLDQASRAVVIDLPTSGGKTALAQFRMLQALNQFERDKGWVAYVAPTRALVSQITRRLREDFGPLEIRVEQLTGAIEIDAFEDAMLSAQDEDIPFHVLVATPEKLQLVIRNKKVSRPLALVILDEAHSIEDEERGLRIELLLATIKRDCDRANFLLLMPNVPNAGDLARWLGADAGRTISIGSSPWQPNERAIGLFSSVPDDSVRGGWRLQFETLATTPKTIHLRGQHNVGALKPLDIPFSKAKGLAVQAGAMAKVFSERGTSIAVAQKINDVWSVARTVRDSLDPWENVPPEVELVQRFLQTEISPEFELIDMLNRGVGVHHTGLSDETRTLMEWLAEIGVLRVLCTTTTLIHGINFPVAAIFLATRKYPYGKEMTARTFWNMAGRAGRVDQESVGIVGLAAGNDAASNRQFVSQATGALISRLVELLDEIEQAGALGRLSRVIQTEQWSDFRCYVAHLWNEKRNLDAVLAETEQILRNTYGYGALRERAGSSGNAKAEALLSATSDYARQLAANPGPAALADATGFAPEGVAAALVGLNLLERQLTPSDWEPASVFGDSATSLLPHLIGIMMRIPEIKIADIGSEGMSHQHVANITRAWVEGRTIQDIATEFFREKTGTDAITSACKAIYKTLTNNGPWGLSALCKISGIDFDQMSPEEKRRINSLPAMVYHGVKTEAAVLMRMNSVPRSIAESMGAEFESRTGTSAGTQTIGVARNFLRSLGDRDWARLAPTGATMSGKDYKDVWGRLSGEGPSAAIGR